MKPEYITIQLNFDDNTVGIMKLITKDFHGIDIIPTEEYILKTINKFALTSTKKIVEWKIIDEETIPKDRTFRNAWKSEQGKIEHDINKAKDLHRAYMREAREPILRQLDIEYIIADEQGDKNKKDEIASKKQLLRDVTSLPEIDNAKTVEELKNVWPKELGNKVF